MISKTSPKVRDNKARFFTHQPDAKDVSVCGSFNNWDKKQYPLNKDDNGWWISDEIKCDAPNSYEYKYIVNGKNEIDDTLNLHVITGRPGTTARFETWKNIYGMTEQLAGIHKSLLENLPGRGNAWVREMSIDILDEYLQHNSSNRSVSIEQFYIRRIEASLAEMDDTSVSNGIYLWQIYNHGFIFRTKETTFAIDLISCRDAWNLSWNIPEEIIDRLVSHIDFLLVTHKHSDHADSEIISKMIEANKSVFAPEEILDDLPTDVKGITDKNVFQHNHIKVIPHKGTHVYDDGRNINIVTYEFETTEGITVLHTGDHDYTINLDFEKLPDIIIPKYDGVSPMHKNAKVIEILMSYGKYGLIIPGHINELSHSPGGGRTSYKKAIYQFRGCESPYQVLIWGEGYHYT